MKRRSETIRGTLNTKEASPPHHHSNQAARIQSDNRSTNKKQNILPSKSNTLPSHKKFLHLRFFAPPVANYIINFHNSAPPPTRTMHLSLAIFAALLPLALSVPSPRGRGGGGGGGGGGGRGGGSSGGGGSSYSSSGNGLTYVAAGVLLADSQNGYTTDNTYPPDAGYDPTTTCDYKGSNMTTLAAANAPAWQTAMNTCLNALSANNWDGTECTPPVGGAFGFYKGENDYSDPVDCFSRCSGCLGSSINASQAVTTKCQYEYRTHRLVEGYKTHTCTMGYETK